MEAAPAEEEEKTTPPPSKPAVDKKQAETVAEETPDKVEEPADLLEEEMEEPSSGKGVPADDMIAQKPEKEKILTEKKPYRMDDLLEGMREMEDMMDEMKDMMDDFKKRRKQ